MIMKKMGFLSVVAGLAIPAMAQDKSDKLINIKAKVRTDAVSNKVKLGSADQTTSAEGFLLKNADVYIDGILPSADGSSYSIKLKPLAIGKVVESAGKGNARGGSVDGATGVIAVAVLNHKIGDMLTLTIGRMGLNVGSVEYDYSSADGYAASLALQNPLYDITSTGIEVAIRPMGEDHTIKLQVLNGKSVVATTQAQDSSGDAYFTAPQGGMNTGIAYYGNMMGGMIKPIISYAQVKTTAAKLVDARPGSKTFGTEFKYDPSYASILAVGGSVIVADLTLELEYDMINVAKIKVNDGQTTAAVVNAQAINSIIGQVKYTIAAANLTPWFKFSSETAKMNNVNANGDSTGDISSTLLAAGAEWNANKAVRYHAGYNQTTAVYKNAAADGSNQTNTTVEMYVGATVKI